ncbi:MAG: hypothetical protein WDO69_27810 [Pseudomonadota bacterium]
MSGCRLGSWLIAATLWLALACGGRVAVERGQSASAGRSAIDGAGGAGAAGSIGIAGSGAGRADADPPPLGEAGATSFVLSGLWFGYLEEFTFRDGTDDVWLSVGGGGGVSGQIRFGNSPVPPLATDAEAIYPPGVTNPSSDSLALAEGPYTGAWFTLLNPEFDGQHLQFDISRNEVFDSWCKLQTPYVSRDGYSCMPDWGSFGTADDCSQQDPTTLKLVPRSCFQLAMCYDWHACSCDGSGCTGSLKPTGHFDLSFEDLEADGSGAGFDDRLPKYKHHLHLTKLQADSPR